MSTRARNGTTNDSAPDHARSFFRRYSSERVIPTALLIQIAPRVGLIDLPNDRKVHTTPTPRGGGIAVVLSSLLVSVVVVYWYPEQNSILWQILLALPVALLGLADDLRPIPWPPRLLAQGVAASVAVLILAPDLSFASFPVAVLWVVGLTNAFNMLDNMDALSAGVAFLTAGALAGGLIVGNPSHSFEWDQGLPYFILIGGLLGFLAFNRPPARIFLGDVGSMYIGFFLATGSLRTLPTSAGPDWRWFVPLCLMATPCYDLTTVVLLRLSQGRSPFHPDKQHLSHRLTDRGLSKPLAVLVIYLCTIASGTAGLLLYTVDCWTGAMFVVLQLALWWAALAVTEFLKRN